MLIRNHLAVMYPFSYACDAMPAHAEDLIEAALGASKASKNVHGTAMLTGSGCELLYRLVVRNVFHVIMSSLTHVCIFAVPPVV